MKTAVKAIVILAIALAAIIITGCDSAKKYDSASFWLDRIDGTTPTNHFELLCDEAMDVAYIKMGWNKGGITVRVDSTGAPVRCSSLRSRRRR